MNVWILIAILAIAVICCIVGAVRATIHEGGAPVGGILLVIVIIAATVALMIWLYSMACPVCHTLSPAGDYCTSCGYHTNNALERDCQHCGKRVYTSSEYCPYCGTPQNGFVTDRDYDNEQVVTTPTEAFSYCTNCGEQVDADDNFCRDCGAKQN